MSEKKYPEIPLSEPLISGNEWRYVKECLDTGWVSSAGGYVERFEKTVAEYAGMRYAVAVVNGTSALHASLIVCGLGPNDEVIVPALTFIAPVNAVRYCGAEPVFMDCEPETLCLDTDKFAEFVGKNTFQKDDGYSYNKDTGRRIKAAVPVHILGHPVDMEGLIKICNARNIDVIEDAAESIGSEYKGKKTGSFGKMGVFSFNGNKIITTGGGGIVATDSENIAEATRHLTTQAKTDHLEYDHDRTGYNYRLTNIQAALGVAQMERLDEFIGIKRKNAKTYSELLKEISEVELLVEKAWAKSNCWLYTIRVPREDKKPLTDMLIEKGIQARPLWKPIHTLPMYKGSQAFMIEEAYEAYGRCINLPCSAGIKQEEIEYVVECIREYFG